MAPIRNILQLLVAVCCFIVCHGSYVITTQREWFPGGTIQVCVQVTNPEAPAGSVNVTIYEERTLIRDKRQVIFPDEEVKVKTVHLQPTIISIPPGTQHLCKDLEVPASNETQVRRWWISNSDLISITGFLAGSSVNHTKTLHRQSDALKTIIQTDKYLYKPGQTVQFRVLSHSGPLMEISTENYTQIYITTPSNNRIAQWLDVDNSKGLIHLSMELADEPEEGSYRIVVDLASGREASTTFKVEEYVLPRYEVTVKGPKYVLGTDNSVTFTACAKYTFGEPVRGNISWKISNALNYECQVVFTKNETISGCSELTVTSEGIRMTDCRVSSIVAEATVTEDGTGAKEKGTKTATVSRRAVTFETLRTDKYMKPNLPYSVKVLAKLPDGSPASGELLEVCHGSSCYNLTTADDGIIKVYITDPERRNVVMQSLITRALMDSPSKFAHKAKRFYSPSNSSLLIFAPEDTISCTTGQETTVELPVIFAAVNQKSAVINVQVMSRGQMQYFKSEEYSLSASPLPFEDELLSAPLSLSPSSTVLGTINIPLVLPPTASPKIKVLVWYIRDDGEVVSDAVEMTVDKCLPNNVDLTWSTNKTQPGFVASWKIASAPDSLCSLGIVDKSVELVSRRNDPITVDSFFFNDQFNLNPWINAQVNDNLYCRRQLETYISDRFNYHYFSEYVDTLKMFDQSGLYVLTDLTLETRPCIKQDYQRVHLPPVRGSSGFVSLNRIAGGSRPFLAAPPPPRPEHVVFSASSGGQAENSLQNTVEEEEPRTEFPETWLWDLVLIPSSGVAEQDVEVPDTITEWVGKAVCIHPQEGVGVSARTSLTTFTPFFVDLTLPPSIKRGEILPVKISVFNYLQQSLPVRVTLEGSPEYELINETSNIEPEGQWVSCVGSNDKQVHTIHIKPSVIGEVNITVSAYVDTTSTLSCSDQAITVTKRDALVRPITVEAEGFLREKSWSKYICANEVENEEDSLDSVELSVPTGMVEGSERAWVTAVGDLLAISLQNLGSLIRMPYGCGEQNMLNFAPNIFILKYLKITRQETPEATSKLLKYMRTGYQRQLLYRHNDGSYSAFGKADDFGSSWLTAFVLKSFAKAKEFINIDEDQLQETSSWLVRTYNKNNDNETCAQSVGKVFHKGMKGGVGTQNSSSVPLTAYILTALLESGHDNSESVVEKSVTCLLSDNSKDSYTLALKAYALALAQEPQTHALIEQLLSQAVITKNSTHWEVPSGLGHYSGGGNALEVETAGYAILAMMTYNSSLYEQQARKIVKWIASKRNGRGGFYTTQDTVIGLQALASYESTQYQGDLNVVAYVEANDFLHSFNVIETNKLLYQEVSLPVLPSNVSFRMEGQGCAVLQTVLRYNDPEPDASDAFSLRVNTETEPDTFCITKRISACATYLLPDGISNMAVIEVNLVSGYIPEKDDLKKILRDNKGVIKRYDVDGSKVSFYIEEFRSDDVCVNFRVIRQVTVLNAKPGSVVVYDYYQPEFSVSKTYNLPAPTSCRNRYF